MLVIVFRARLKPGLRDEYVALVDRMAELARTMPGYVSHKGFLQTTASGSLSSSLSTKKACAPGGVIPSMSRPRNWRARSYTEYHVQVCTLDRESRFRLDEAAVAGQADCSAA